MMVRNKMKMPRKLNRSYPGHPNASPSCLPAKGGPGDYATDESFPSISCATDNQNLSKKTRGDAQSLFQLIVGTT